MAALRPAPGLAQLGQHQQSGNPGSLSGQWGAALRPPQLQSAQRALNLRSTLPAKPAAQSGALPVSRQEPVTGARAPPRDVSGIPQELADLNNLVSQLNDESKAAEIQELKKAFGELTQDLKRQISNVHLSANPSASSSLAANVPGRRRLTPATGPEEFRASAGLGLSDLEGLFPCTRSSQRAEEGAGEEGEGAPKQKEPSVPRSEVMAMRSRLNKKLSESNTYNRFLNREIQYREDAIRDTKALLVALVGELKEVQSAVVELASAEPFLPVGTVSSSCMPSVVRMKVQGLVADLEQQLQGVEAMKLREVPLTWFGMAEDVKVMGSFDGWTYGEQMSPEFTGTMTRFTTVLKLRPGRYEIKFVVDGDWRVAPQWPTEGHGMTENNVLVVD